MLEFIIVAALLLLMLAAAAAVFVDPGETSVRLLLSITNGMLCVSIASWVLLESIEGYSTGKLWCTVVFGLWGLVQLIIMGVRWNRRRARDQRY